MDKLEYIDFLRVRLPYNYTIVTEVSKKGIIKLYLKTFLDIDSGDYNAANWFSFEVYERKFAIEDTNPIVEMRGRYYLKVYRVLDKAPRNDSEKKVGRRYFMINKHQYPGGYWCLEKLKYPRPKFHENMYEVLFYDVKYICNRIRGNVKKLIPDIVFLKDLDEFNLVGDKMAVLMEIEIS